MAGTTEKIKNSIQAIGDIPRCIECEGAKNLATAACWVGKETCHYLLGNSCNDSSCYSWVDQGFQHCFRESCDHQNVLMTQCEDILGTIIVDDAYTMINCQKACGELYLSSLPYLATGGIGAEEAFDFIRSLNFMCPKICETALTEAIAGKYKSFDQAFCDLALGPQDAWTKPKKDDDAKCQINEDCKSGFCRSDNTMECTKIDEMGFKGGWPEKSWPNKNCKDKTDEGMHKCSNENCAKWLTGAWGPVEKEGLTREQACDTDFGKTQCPETCCLIKKESECNSADCVCGITHTRPVGIGCGEDSDCLSNYCASPLEGRSCDPKKDGAGCICLDCPSKDCSARKNGTGCAKDKECLSNWCASPRGAVQCGKEDATGCTCEDPGSIARAGRTAARHPRCGTGAGNAGFAPDVDVCPDAGGEYLECCEKNAGKTDLCLSATAQSCGERLLNPDNMVSNKEEFFWVRSKTNHLGLIEIECAGGDHSKLLKTEAATMPTLHQMDLGCNPNTRISKWTRCELPRDNPPDGPGPVQPPPSRRVIPAPTGRTSTD